MQLTNEAIAYQIVRLKAHHELSTLIKVLAINLNSSFQKVVKCLLEVK